MVRKPQSPCSQVVKRILERGTTPVPRVVGLGLRREHVNGPLPAMFPNAVQYSVYKTEQFTQKLDRANCYVSIEGCFESLSKRWGLSCHTSDLNTDKDELPADRQQRKPSTQDPSKSKICQISSCWMHSCLKAPFGAGYSNLSRRKLAHPPTPRLTPPAHPTSSYSEVTTINWQQEAEYEGLGSPELSVNTNMPQCRETPLPRPGLPHRTPQSQRFARSAPAGCTAV
ncbi:hypothetical protein DPEC_G00237260 [Dallia pectoralis]|uniref:Uncharacterized protein n=1 Tax=Dallia pectoralis TaxID=75939 RepID=A0ACC2FYR1_DALPE|nr:hypothetical protein DPEC_G00237260 [Dallia pectoralis]